MLWLTLDVSLSNLELFSSMVILFWQGDMIRSADYVIVGAGAAGCVLANRLSENPSCQVVLLEAGGKNWNPLLKIPLMTGLLLRSSYANWLYKTEPEPRLNGRRLNWARGKVLGGSTSINGMVYMRGLPSDYDHWAQRGLKGWSYADVLPYFKKSEYSDRIAGMHRGHNGPLQVTRANLRNPLFEVYNKAAQQAGHQLCDDFSLPDAHGTGYYDFTIGNGRRISAASAYLDPISSRPNLTIVTDAHVAGLTISQQLRATGLKFKRAGQDYFIEARCEIILSGGAINSPQLLMLSGIGPQDHLKSHGIQTHLHAPGVGQGLQDHLLVRVEHECLRDVTIDRLRRPDRAAIAFLQAFFFGTGPASTFPLEAGGLYKSHDNLEIPDLQSHFLPGFSSASLRLPYFSQVLPQDRGAGFFSNIYQLRPESEGSVTLSSADPFAPVQIRPNYLSSDKDRQVLRQGVKILRDIFKQKAFDGWRGAELSPGPACQSDQAIDDWIAQTADTAYHPTSTCKMGAENDKMAVLDEKLCVRGIESLRVVDASSFPSIPSGNTAAPTMMLAEKAADMIQEKARH